MKLPEDIERELLYIWSGQQAGFPKLRGLRGAIERHMAALAAARTVLDGAEDSQSLHSNKVLLIVDRAAWLAWRALAAKEPA